MSHSPLAKSHHTISSSHLLFSCHTCFHGQFIILPFIINPFSFIYVQFRNRLIFPGSGISYTFKYLTILTRRTSPNFLQTTLLLLHLQQHRPHYLLHLQMAVNLYLGYWRDLSFLYVKVRTVIGLLLLLTCHIGSPVRDSGLNTELVSPRGLENIPSDDSSYDYESEGGALAYKLTAILQNNSTTVTRQKAGGPPAKVTCVQLEPTIEQ